MPVLLWYTIVVIYLTLLGRQFQLVDKTLLNWIAQGLAHGVLAETRHMSLLLQQPCIFFAEAIETHRDLWRPILNLEMCRFYQKMRLETGNLVVYITQNRQIWTCDTIAMKPRYVEFLRLLWLDLNLNIILPEINHICTWKLKVKFQIMLLYI